LIPGTDRDNFWFGTEEYMQWIRTPNRATPINTESWSSSGVFLNGGGYSQHSFGGHLVYIFEWPESSSRQLAQLMRDYRRGTYGRGLIYFIHPFDYDLNILSSRVADPSQACDDEGASLVYGLTPDAVPTSGWQANRLPVQSAYYDLGEIASGWRDDGSDVFIPIPAGYTLYLGAVHSVTGSGAIRVRSVDSSGNLGTASSLSAVSASATDLCPDTFSGGRGVRIQLGKTSSGAATVTPTALVGRLYRTGDTPPSTFTAGPWSGGMGNSGCRFEGEPTFVPNSGMDGGQIGFAASFREVGSWV